MDLRFLANGHRLLTSGDPGGNLLEEWQVESGQRAAASFTLPSDPYSSVLAIAASADEQLFAVATLQRTLILHPASARVLFTIKGTWSDVTFSGAGGEWLAVSSRNATQVWDVRAARQVPHAALPGLPGPERPRRSRVALTGDGRLLALVDQGEQTVSLFDARTGARRTTLHGHDGKVRAVAFTPDGSVLRAVAEDWTVHDHPVDIPRLVSLARSRVNRPLTAEECQRFLGRTSCPAAP
jgi:hypothetical protein